MINISGVIFGGMIGIVLGLLGLVLFEEQIFSFLDYLHDKAQRIITRE